MAASVLTPVKPEIRATAAKAAARPAIAACLLDILSFNFVHPYVVFVV